MPAVVKFTWLAAAQEAKDKLIKTGKYAKGGLADVKRKTTIE